MLLPPIYIYFILSTYVSLLLVYIYFIFIKTSYGNGNVVKHAKPNGLEDILLEDFNARVGIDW